jgi:flagellar biosynthesis protein FlhF
VSVETYRGPVLAALLAQAEEAFGGHAVIVETRQVRGPAGERIYEVVATHAERAAKATRKAATARPSEAPPVELIRTPSRGRTSEVIAFVGPTGAGKTTMLAKVAGHATIFGSRRVGMLGLDTFRVGAVEQLALYAGMAKLPVEVAYEATDLPRAMKRLRHCDVILVDCPGRSPKRPEDVDAVRGLLRELRPTEVHAVLPAGLRTEHARRLLDGYRSLGVTHLCATKIDEYPDDWALFDLAAQLQLPMRWIGDGQSVPADVRSAAARLDAARAHLGARRRHGEEIVA